MHLHVSLRRISQCSGLDRPAGETNEMTGELQRLDDAELVTLTGQGEVGPEYNWVGAVARITVRQVE